MKDSEEEILKHCKVTYKSYDIIINCKIMSKLDRISFDSFNMLVKGL